MANLNTNLSQISNEELARIAGVTLQNAAQPADGVDFVSQLTGDTAPDTSKMSNEELAAIAGIKLEQPTTNAQPVVGKQETPWGLGATEAAIKGGAGLVANLAAPFMSEDSLQKLEQAGLYSRRNPVVEEIQARGGIQNAGDAIRAFSSGINQSPIGQYGSATYAGISAPLTPVLEKVGEGLKAAGVSDTGMEALGAGMNILGVAGIRNPTQKVNTVAKVRDMVSSPKIKPAEVARAEAADAYRVADESGQVFAPKDVGQKIVAKINEKLEKPIGGKLLPEQAKINNALEQYSHLGDKPLSISEINALDQDLTSAITSSLDPATRGYTNLSRKLQSVQNAVRDSVHSSEGGAALKRARDLWSQQAKLNDLETMIKRAEMTKNPATSIQTQMRNYVLNAKKTRGYSAQELKLMEKVAKGSAGVETLATLGGRLIPQISLAAGGGFTGTGAAMVGTMASRGGATKLAIRGLNKIRREVSNRPIASKAEIEGAIVAGKAREAAATQAAEAARKQKIFDDYVKSLKE